MLTNSDLKQILDALARYGKKDSQLETVPIDLEHPEGTFTTNDYLSIVQDGKNKTIKIKNLEKVFLLTFLTDEDFREALKGRIPGEMLENASVTTEKLADGSITTIKLGNSSVTNAKLSDNAVTSSKLADNSVTAGKIVDGSVTTSKLNTNAVTTDKLANGSVTTDKIANGAVTSSKIADNSLSGANFGNNTIEGIKIKDNSIPGSKLADGAIESIDIKDGTLSGSKLADNSVTGAKLQDSVITGMKIADNSIPGSKIADSTIQNLNIANNSISGSKLVDNAITTDKIANNAINSAKLANDAITENKIVDDSVTTNKIADRAVTNSKLANNSVTSDKIADNSVTSSMITDYAVTENKLDSGSVTASKIAPNAVTTTKLGNNAITSDKIVDGSVTEQKLADNSVTTDKIDTDAVTNVKIADNAVTESKIATNAITTAKIVDSSVTTVKIADNTVTTVKLADGAVTEDKLANGAVTTAKLADGLISEIQNITDATPTEGSVKPVQSGGVKTAIDTFETNVNQQISNKLDVSYSGIHIDVEPDAHKYIVYNTGVIATSTSYNTYGVTDFISVANVTGYIAEGLFCTSHTSGCAVYDENKNFLRSVSIQTTTDKCFYWKYDGDAYIRFTVGNIDNFKVYDYPEKNVTETKINDYPANKIAPETVIADLDKNLFTLTIGNNLLDPINILFKDHIFLNTTGNIAVSNTAATLGVTGVIPFGNYTRLFINQSAHSGSIRNCVYDVNGNFLRAVSGYTVTKNSDEEFYVRFTIKSNNETPIVSGDNYIPDYEPYTKNIKINSELIGDISVDNITPTEFKFLSKNICDPEECTFGSGYYLNRNTGDVAYSSSSSANGYTGYIPIDNRGLYITYKYYAGTSIGGAVYDRDKHYIRPIQSEDAIQYQDGDAYIRYSISSSGNADNIIVSVGQTPIAYEPYAGKIKVISRDILPNFKVEGGDPLNMVDGVEVQLPSKIYVNQGDSLQLFWRGIVEAVNPYIFSIYGKCSNGNSYPRYLQLNTATANGSTVSYLSVGSRTLDVVVKNNENNIVSTGSTTINIINNPTSPASMKNILCVGASTLASGNVIKEVQRRLTETDGVELNAVNINNRTYYNNPKGLGLSNISFVGRQLSSAGVRQDGVSGRRMKDIVTAGSNIYTFLYTPNSDYSFIQGDTYTVDGLVFTVQGSDDTHGDVEMTLSSGSGTPPASGTLTLQTGTGTISVAYNSVNISNSNPFWNATLNKIDFAQYSNNYCDGADIDILYSLMGINDIFSATRAFNELIDNTRQFIDAYHNDFPNGYVVLTAPALPDVTGGMGASYPGSSSSYWDIVKRYFAYAKDLNELVSETQYKDWVFICTTMYEFDNEYLYLKKTVPTSNHSTLTEQIGINALHFGESGQKTVADSIYHSISNVLNVING